MKRLIFILVISVISLCACGYGNALSLYRSGRYSEAFAAYTNLLFASDVELRDGLAAQSVLDAARSLASTNRISEAEGFLVQVRAWHSAFAVRLATVQALKELPKEGRIACGAFVRGGRKSTHSVRERDRVIRLRWLEELLPDVDTQTNLRKRWFWNEMADALSDGQRANMESWRFAELTNLSSVPDVTALPEYERQRVESATQNRVSMFAVNEAGELTFPQCVKNWADARNDGERWMFANEKRANVDYAGRRKSAASLAYFANANYGTQSLSIMPEVSLLADELVSLRDDESLFFTTRGVMRAKLPPEFNYIRHWKECGNYLSLGQEYARRRKYSIAAEMFSKAGVTNNLDKTVPLALPK